MLKSPVLSLQEKIKSYQDKLKAHEAYASIHNVNDLQIFMKYHVYAVWDFMSLLKALQKDLTCVTVPWYPKGSADVRYLINEIVTGEESDVDINGVRKSHFEIYLDAMKQAGADVQPIQLFLDTLKKTGDLEMAFNRAQTPEQARAFVTHTFEVITSGKTHVQSAVFTFGREDLIPDMFLSIVNDLDQKIPDQISIFNYYLKRHIEVDGDHHSHLALKMTTDLCGNNEMYWLEAGEAVIEALQKRISLWDGVWSELKNEKTPKGVPA